MIMFGGGKAAADSLPLMFLIRYAALLSALLLARGTLGSDPEVNFAGGCELEPGRAVRVTWSPLPKDTEEFELLLKFESPFPAKIRLTECKDPELDSLAWVVPRIPCERARLLLRRGEGGREIDWAWSRTFSIRGSPYAPVQRTAFYRGEMWATDDNISSLRGRRNGGPGHRAAQGGISDLRSTTDDPLRHAEKTKGPVASGLSGKQKKPERLASDRAPMKLVLRL